MSRAATGLADTIVVGAGVAGSAAAIRLAAAGQRLILIDREAGPSHKVCGEFLSGPAATHLAALGLEPAALGAHPVSALRIVSGAQIAEAALPFAAWGLSRRRLDTALRQRAAEAGADLRLGKTVRRLEDGQATLADGEVLRARRIVLATGKHELAGCRRDAPGLRRMVGFKLHLGLAGSGMARLGECIELHLFDGGYAGLQPVADGVANLSFVVDERAFAAAGRSFAGALAAAAPRASLLAERLAGHQPHWPKPLAVANIPYGFRLWRLPEGPGWLWPVGDQAVVIPSFTGDGMAIAMASAASAAGTILSGGSVADHRSALRAETGRQVLAAELIGQLLASLPARRMAMPALAMMPWIASAGVRLTRGRPLRRPCRARPGR